MQMEFEPSEWDRRAFAAANQDRKMVKRNKLSARKDGQDLINDMDPASCGLQCQTAPAPLEVLRQNEEYQELFPEQSPHGLPPSRPTYRGIDFPEKFMIPDPRLYRLASSDGKALLKQLDNLKGHDYFTEVTSTYGSGILFSPHANWKLRMVVDYRPINNLTVVDKYPIPRIDEMLDRVGDASYNSELDLHLGFHQTRDSITRRTHSVPDQIRPFCVSCNTVRIVQRHCDNSKDNGLYFQKHAPVRGSLNRRHLCLHEDS